MTPRVTWDVSVPAEVRAVAEPLVARWLWTVPSWCHHLLIEWGQDDDDEDGGRGTAAASEAQIGYRDAAILLCPTFLEQTADERDATVRHELLHVCLAPLWSAYREAIEPHETKTPALHAALERTGRRALEGAVCDLTAALLSANPERLTAREAIAIAARNGGKRSRAR